MKKWISIGLLGMLLLASSCNKNDVNIDEELPEQSIIEEESEAENPLDLEVDHSESEQDSEDGDLTQAQLMRDRFVAFLFTGPDIIEVKTYIDENIRNAQISLADDMLAELIVRGEVGLVQQMDLLFEEDMVGIHAYLFDIYEKNTDRFTNGYVFLGNEKNVLLSLMDDASYKRSLQTLFDQGYGLYSAEGNFYPTVDYLFYLQKYGIYLGEMTKSYLSILSEFVIEPTTIEEYLAISPEALKERAYRSEKFLMDYPGAPIEYKRNISQNLTICLWKLSSPNIFDGMLDEDFTVSAPTQHAYDDILKEKKTPVVTFTVQSVTDWINTQEGGVLGSYEDMDRLYNQTNEIFNASQEMMQSLYPVD
ncbi:hypothetical protein [Petrocella sp. FN5]|uniref:hypothetical protein n=1 Tax=Petrocella sp. FN5 TaxID=3032002 RepID=UPI0023DB6A2A|nr:hypothetical protein [Petrocella sp. FN5]MDF1618399.1 hypothetical protein [Petrocella sp. FN5]